MSRPRVFLDVNIGEEPAGRLVIELFNDHAPKTSENFRQLCTGEHDGLSYAKSPFHRIIEEFMIQGGDVEHYDGTGTLNIYGKDGFEDEWLDWREIDAKGLVCSANRGRNTNGCQFFITLDGENCRHLSGKHTVFGQLVKGTEVLDRIANVQVDKQDRPLEPVLVSRCGELEKRKKSTTQQHNSNSIIQESRDRGRRRRSTDRDVEMEDSPEPRSIQHKHRRQSDNVVDEGLRGRPRQRSRSRSPPGKAMSAHSEDSEDERTGDSTDRSSPTKVHKRKRSASPSRHSNGERRRRSLPNQYKDDRFRPREDEDRYRPSPRRDDYRHPSRRKDEHRHDRYPGRQRQDDRYRPSRERNPGYGDDGRLGGGAYDENEPPVKFKGRGFMKY